MKQNISENQLKEIKGNARRRLLFWWNKNYLNETIPGSSDSDQYGQGHYEEPLLSIGQMIEFLEEYDSEKAINVLSAYQHEVYKGDMTWLEYSSLKDLCDALWEAVKEVLNA